MSARVIPITTTELHRSQALIKADPHRFKVACCGRRFGKNVLLHDLVLETILAGEPCGFGSPGYKNFNDDWRMLRHILLPITTYKNEQEYRIETLSGGVLEMWTLDNPELIRGKAYKRFIINEAAFIPYLMNTWNKILRATLIDKHGDCIFAGTPNGLNDYHILYSLGAGDNKEWKSFHFTSYDNPFIDPAELDSIRASSPDRDFRQEYLAEFIQGEGAVFRNLDAVTLAPKSSPGEHSGHTIVAGVDWGKEGDYTSVSLGCVTCRREVLLDRFNQVDYEFQYGRLENLRHQWNVYRWKVELNSIGVPNFEQLQRRGFPLVGFTTTIQSKMTLIEGFSLALERGDVMLLPDDVGKAELLAMQRTTTKTGLSSYAAPEGMHDDTVMSRALMHQMMMTTIPYDELAKRRTSTDQAMEQLRKLF